MSNSDLAVFEPRGGETWRDPFTMYEALRDHDPVHRVASGDGDYWVLSRFADVFAAVDGARSAAILVILAGESTSNTMRGGLPRIISLTRIWSAPLPRPTIRNPVSASGIKTSI